MSGLVRTRAILSYLCVAFLLGGSALGAASLTQIRSTESALVDQIACKNRPQVARAINAMLENGVIRYIDNENGTYLFAPKVPLSFLGMPITHISGFDQDQAFHHVPYSRMVGTPSPHFIEVDVLATANELKQRAIAAGLVEAIPAQGKSGFRVNDLGHYLAAPGKHPVASIECDD